jgi:hypothetical protein
MVRVASANNARFNALKNGKGKTARNGMNIRKRTTIKIMKNYHETDGEGTRKLNLGSA